MTPEERTAFEKRRRARNIALYVTLVALALLFFFVSMARKAPA
ncbi:hypothetical protein [Falsiroseomonas sp. HW251]